MPVHPVDRLLIDRYAGFGGVGPAEAFDFEIAVLAEGAGQGWMPKDGHDLVGHFVDVPEVYFQGVVEHFADGDLFDNTLEPGWAPLTASGLAQWGPPATRDFLGTDLKSARHELVSMVSALRDSNEFNISRLIGLLKVPTS